jgi:hypothetical protein
MGSSAKPLSRFSTSWVSLPPKMVALPKVHGSRASNANLQKSDDWLIAGENLIVYAEVQSGRKKII